MNTTTLNMTTLDDGRIIKRGEGGGSTPPSGDSGVEYVSQALSSSSSTADLLWKRATLVKIKFGSYVVIDSPILIYNMFTQSGIEFHTSYIEAMCVDFKAKIVMPEEGEFTIEEFLGPDKNLFTPITKEQFYNLD